MRVKLGYDTHLPVLIRMVGITSGPILELGAGFFSTPFLHWACRRSGRRLVTMERNQEMVDYFRRYNKGGHSIVHTPRWEDADLSGPWSLALVDHDQGVHRGEALRQLLDQADFVIAHDTQRKHFKKYNYTDTLGLYRHSFQYRGAYPYTTILSNKYEVAGLMV